MLRRLAWFAGGMGAGHLLTLQLSDVDIRDAWASKVSHYRTELMRRMQMGSVQSAEQALMQANQKVLSSQIQLDTTRQEKNVVSGSYLYIWVPSRQALRNRRIPAPSCTPCDDSASRTTTA
eukprot:TRINITY_DN13136_c0_g1_i2.p2 TRINITY_DN13136_c0_g1~~TRINITY_DN13136_c0_g1_i2.p2  ORF type:complete len:128 (-),score=10.84 TRINITY_DN13136_c0_g1_i2:193-555(-)